MNVLQPQGHQAQVTGICDPSVAPHSPSGGAALRRGQGAPSRLLADNKRDTTVATWRIPTAVFVWAHRTSGWKRSHLVFRVEEDGSFEVLGTAPGEAELSWKWAHFCEEQHG